MKKLFAICLSVLLLCAAMPFASAIATEEATIVLSDVEAKAGETVSVTLSLKNNPGIVSAKIRVGYDSDVLELVEKPTPGEAYPAGNFSYSKELTNNPYIVNFCDAIADADYTDELLSTLTFKVKDGAAAGTYPLTLSYSCEDDFYNCDANGMEVVEFGADEGSVTVVEDAPVVPEPPVEPEEPEFNVPTVYLPQINAEAGAEISVPVMLKKNPGLVSAKIRVGYDSSVLELVAKPTPGEAYPAGNFSYSKELTNNPYIVNFCDAIADADYTAELLSTLTFKVKDDAAAGTYALTLEFSCEDDFYNCDANGMEIVEFAACEGAVIIAGDEPVIPEPPVECEHEYDAVCDPECNLCGEIRPVHTEGIIHFDAVEAGCHYNGNIEYWFCPECEIFWQDAELTQLTNSKNVIVPAKGGDVIAFEAVEPGCHYNGNIAYWFCAECEQFWQDAELTQLTNSKNVILPAVGSENLQHIEAVEPTCNSEGNIEHWFCPDCEQYWQDEALTQLTNSKNVKLGVTEHNIIHFDAVEPGCHYVGNIEYWFCSICEGFWQNAELTQLTNSKNVILPAKGGDVIAFEAVEPGCHYNGNIAYWFCAECECFWQDEALTQLTNSKNVILPAVGSENLQHIEAVAPTCQSEGNIEHWFCPDCEQFWQDEALTQLTNSKNVKIGPADHNIVHIEAVEAGCHYIGNIEYWYCTECEIFWQDAELTQITNSKNVIVPAKGGDVVAFEAVEPGCHYIGNIAYWYCPECEQFWQDEALTQLTNSKNVILPAIGSENVEHVEAKDPTCLDAGNIEYWFCADCEQYWQDEALTQLTNSKNVKIAPVDHTIVHFDAVAPGCHYNGNIEYWFCSVCEMFWQDAELTQITNSKNVILPAIGSENLQHVEAKEPVGHENGNIEYWFCPDCEQFWQDAALTQLTNSKNVIIANTNVEYVIAIDPTETEAGNKAHWFCHDCGKYFLDAELTQETTKEEITIPATGVVEPEKPDQPDQPEKPDSPDTGDSTVAVVVALLTLIVSGVAVSVLKNKKRA